MENITTVLHFNTAIIGGYEPGNYSWDKQVIPTGKYDARLDFMIWSKKQMAINCYFTTEDNNSKIILSAYRSKDKEEKYLAGNTEMRHIPFNVMMNLEVQLNSMGNPSLKNAVVIHELPQNSPTVETC